MTRELFGFKILAAILVIALWGVPPLVSAAPQDEPCIIVDGEDYLYIEGRCAKDCLEGPPASGIGIEDPVDLCPIGNGPTSTTWNPSGRAPGTACDENYECASAECSSNCLWDSVNPETQKGCCSNKREEQCLQPDNCQSMTCDRPNPARPGKCKNNPSTGGDNRINGSACSNHRDCQSGKCRTQGSTGRKCVP